MSDRAFNAVMAALSTCMFILVVVMAALDANANAQRLRRLEERWDALKHERPSAAEQIKALRERVRALEEAK